MKTENRLTAINIKSKKEKKKSVFRVDINIEWVTLQSRENDSSFCHFLAIYQEINLLTQCPLNVMKTEKSGFQVKMLF